MDTEQSNDNARTGKPRQMANTLAPASNGKPTVNGAYVQSLVKAGLPWDVAFSRGIAADQMATKWAADTGRPKGEWYAAHPAEQGEEAPTFAQDDNNMANLDRMGLSDDEKQAIRDAGKETEQHSEYATMQVAEANKAALKQANDDYDYEAVDLKSAALSRNSGHTQSIDTPEAPLSETLQDTQERHSALDDIAKATKSQPLYQIGDDPERLAKLTDIGGYHYEEGASKWGDWVPRVKADVPALDDADLGRIYSNVKKEIAKYRNPIVQARAEISFHDERAMRIQRGMAADLINTMVIDYPDALRKVLDGHEKALTADERTAFDDLRYAAARRREGGPEMTNEAVNTLRDIINEVDPPQARTGKPRQMANTLEAAVKRRIGARGWQSLQTRESLDHDLSMAMSKLDKGNGETLTDSEKRAFTENLDDLSKKPSRRRGPSFSKQLAEMAEDAKAGRICFSDTENLVRDLLIREFADDPDRLTEALHDMLKVVPGDFHDLANRYNRRATPGWLTAKGFGARLRYLIRSLLDLGSLIFILGYAVMEEGLVNPALALVSGGKLATAHPADLVNALKAGKEALPEARRILTRGVTAHEMRNVSRYQRVYKPSKEPIANAAMRIPARFHYAVLYIVREMAEEAALQRTARLFARNFGGEMEDYLRNPEVKKAAYDHALKMICRN